MPKKNVARTGRTRAPAAPDARPARTTRSAPRPSAILPVGTADVIPPPPAAPAPAPAAPTTNVPRAPRNLAPVTRMSRPPRTGGLSAINDYGYVMSDLRRIGALAVLAFAALIGLTFVVH